MKKAIMISFKFILSMVIGALILIFFIFFAFQHISLSEKTSAVEIVNYLDLKLDILSNSQSASTQFNLPDKKDINFFCNKIYIDYKQGTYSTTTDKIIASPVKLKQKDLQIWTKSWFFPFKITNFYYIANKNINFYIEDTNLLNKIPKIFNTYQIQEINKDADKNIIVFSSQPRNLQELLKNNAKVLHILNDNQITFYPEAKTTSYLGEEMLLLAIFSSNYNEYECLKQKATQRLDLISSIYRQKSLLLKTKAKQECSFIYTQLASNLDNLPTTLNPNKIKQQNEELEYNACPKIY